MTFILTVPECIITVCLQQEDSKNESSLMSLVGLITYMDMVDVSRHPYGDNG